MHCGYSAGSFRPPNKAPSTTTVISGDSIAKLGKADGVSNGRKLSPKVALGEAIHLQEVDTEW